MYVLDLKGSLFISFVMCFSFSLLLEISPPATTLWDNLTAESAFETAVHSPLGRQDVQTLWIEYLFYQRSKASRDKSSSSLLQQQSMDELVNRCLMSVSTSCSLPHSSSAVWQDYRFHNQVSPNLLNMRRVLVLYSQPIRFVRFDGKSEIRGPPVLEPARGLNSWCWPKGFWPLGTRMASSLSQKLRPGWHKTLKYITCIFIHQCSCYCIIQE